MKKILKKYLSRHKVWTPVKYVCYRADIRVVIPLYLEEDYIEYTLKSLVEAVKECSKAVEVVVVVNYSENALDITKLRQQQMLDLLEQQKEKFKSFFNLSLIKAFDLPSKHAGAGLARKIGMDYAVSRYVAEHNVRGIILSLDADCLVQRNYFNAVAGVFDDGVTNGCTLYFEHVTNGISARQKEAIEEYELHLRYYLQALRSTGHPYVFHTVGSCFAVTAEAYARAGGMPRKQAGEDFYFLQKVIPLGHFRELNSTCVYPSSRVSDRVPFGTGPTVGKMVNEDAGYLTYSLQAFVDLKAFFDIRNKFYKVNEAEYLDLLDGLSESVKSFLLSSVFFAELKHINANCSSQSSFLKRFYEIFDVFKVVKYLNYVHDRFFKKMAVYDASLYYLKLMGIDITKLTDTAKALKFFRALEKESLEMEEGIGETEV